MHTGNDCLVCFMRQALGTVRRCTDDPALQWQIVTEVGGLLPGFDPHLPPPENAVHYYRLISERTGVADPFRVEKQESNAFALDLEPRTRELIAQEEDPLLAAIQFSINANVLDYGAQVLLDRDAALASCRQELAINHYTALRRFIDQRARILYLADNCGEIVFDKLLIELLLAHGCEVTLAVRRSPTINDATPEDARRCGLEALCPVIDNGADVPGTPLDSCSESFRRRFAEADCIISKGMGNFECLSEIQAPIFFLFIVKCTTVRRYLNQVFSGAGLEIGSPILLEGRALLRDR
ncbi:MAG: ARMT1-like domain-containing protein [Desulfobulbus sp.]|nr:ARMT1-like domain-containing protein [Desulfobulbus sp.]